MSEETQVDAPAKTGPAKLQVFIGCMVLVFITYRPTLRSDFVRLDDYQYIVHNKLVREPTLRGVGTFFGEIGRPSTVEGYYQPLTMLSYMIDSVIAGPHAGATIFHFTNIVLHGVNSFLVILLLVRVLRLHGGYDERDEGWDEWMPALLAGMFFALHPAQVESVAWISQRKTLLATCFALLAMLMYLDYGRSGAKRKLIGAVLFYFLGTLSKPTIVLFPLILPLLDRWPLRRTIGRHLIEKWPFALVMVVMGWIAWSSQAAFDQALMVPNLGTAELVDKWVALISYNFMLYLGNLFWPMHLSPFRAIPEDLSFGSAPILLSLIGTAAVIGVWLIAWRCSRPLFTGLTAFLILLLPSLGGLRFMGSCVADRFLYLPMIFLLMPLAVLIAKGDYFMRARVKEYRTVVGLFALPMFILTIGQQNVWADSKTLYSHVTQTAPRWFKGHFNMAQIALEEENFNAAVDSANRAITLNPGDGPSYIIKGQALIRQKKLDEGIAALQKSFETSLGPDEAEAWLSLAEGQALGSDLPGARASCAKAIALGDKPTEVFTRVGDMVLRVGKQYERATELLREAIAADGDNYLAHLYLANALAALGRDADALREYDISIALQRKKGFDVSELESRTRYLRDKSTQAATKPTGDLRP